MNDREKLEIVEYREKLIVKSLRILRQYNKYMNTRQSKCNRRRITTAKELHYYLSYERDNWFKTVPDNQVLVSNADYYTGLLLIVYKNHWNSIPYKQQRKILRYITEYKRVVEYHKGKK